MNGEKAFDPRRARRQLLLVFLVLVVAVTVIMTALVMIYGMASVRAGWDFIQPTVRAVKWAGMIVLIWRWDEIIHWIARRQYMNHAYRNYLLSMRWRVAGALLVLETLFGQNLLAHLLN